MDSEITSVGLALLSAVFIGSSTVILKFSTSRVKPLLVNFLKSLTGITGLLMIIIATNPHQLYTLKACHVITCFYIAFTGPFLAWYLYIRALKEGEVSLVHPIANIYPIIAMVIGFVALGSRLTALHIIGAILVIYGIRNILYTSKRSERASKEVKLKPVLGALSAAGLWGINAVLFKYLLAITNPLLLAFLRSLFSTLIMLPLIIIFRKECFSNPSPKHMSAAVLAGFTSDIVGIMIWLTSLQLGEIASVTTIASTAPLFSAFLSQKIFGEKPSPRRWWGVTLSVIGIMLVTAA